MNSRNGISLDVCRNEHETNKKRQESHDKHLTKWVGQSLVPKEIVVTR